MTDIATRYMRLVEKRPELAATLKGLPIGVRVDDFGTPWWTVNDDGWTIETENGDEQMHAIVSLTLIENLPTGVVLHHNKDWPEAKDREGNNAARGNWWVQYIVKRSEQLKDWPGACGATPFEAVLAFWEGQV